MVLWLAGVAAAVEVGGDLHTAGRAYTELPATGVSRGVELVRARAAGELATESVSARLTLLMAPSGGEDGYVGVSGESWVPVVEIAEGRLHLPAGVVIGAGLVDTPSLLPVLEVWRLPSVAPALEEWMTPRSDEGGYVDWAHPDAPVGARLAAVAGEGAATRERNNGVDVAGVFWARPVEPLTLMVHGRDGSVGLEQGRNHRAGAGVLLDLPDTVAAGLEGHLGWGFEGDLSLLPGGWGAWARSGDALPVIAWASLYALRHHRPDPDSSDSTLRLGCGPRIGDPEGGSGWLAAGWEMRRLGSNASAIAGDAATLHTIFVQLDVRLSAQTGGAP